MLYSELKHLLATVMDDLPEHYRTVLVMRDVDGLDTAETAECLSISEKTVEARLYEAGTLMRNHLYARGSAVRHEVFSF